MTFWGIVGLGVILLLVGFIVLQRRKKGVADRIAAGLDSALKRGAGAVAGVLKKGTEDPPAK